MNAGVDDLDLAGGLDARDAERILAGLEKLERYLGCLSDVEREVFWSMEVEGNTLEETSQALDRARGTVSTQILRAQKKIKQCQQADALQERGGVSG